MAQRLAVSGAGDLKFIFNVSKHVGPFDAQPNDKDDVQLVQFLLREGIKASGVKVKPGIDVPRPTGQFDAQTGFWIYRIQDGMHDSSKSVVIDGIVSPAKGVFYTINSPWAIVFLNYTIKQKAPLVFSGIPTNPELSPTLRASLS